MSKFIVVAILASASVLHGADVTINLSGYVTQIDGNVPTGASVGDIVNMTAVYDIASPDLHPDPARTFHNLNTPTAFLRVDVLTSSGTLSFWAGPAGGGNSMNLWTYDQSVYSPGDYFELSGANSTGVNWPSALFLDNNQIINSMLDQSAPYDMIDGVTLPPSGLPDLSKVTFFNGEVRGFRNSGGYFDIHWNLNPVPEPSACALVGLGAVLLAVFHMRRSQ